MASALRSRNAQRGDWLYKENCALTCYVCHLCKTASKLSELVAAQRLGYGSPGHLHTQSSNSVPAFACNSAFTPSANSGGPEVVLDKDGYAALFALCWSPALPCFSCSESS